MFSFTPSFLAAFLKNVIKWFISDDEGEHMKLARLKLAVDYKQKKVFITEFSVVIAAVCFECILHWIDSKTQKGRVHFRSYYHE